MLCLSPFIYRGDAGLCHLKIKSDDAHPVYGARLTCHEQAAAHMLSKGGFSQLRGQRESCPEPTIPVVLSPMLLAKNPYPSLLELLSGMAWPGLPGEQGRGERRG